MFSELSRVAAAKPARPAPTMMTPVFFSCNDGGESTEICEDALGGLNMRWRWRWEEEQRRNREETKP